MFTLRSTSIALVSLLALTGCTANAADDDIRPDSAEPVTISVPEDTSTIQSAVDAAEPGDTVEISDGEYNETVAVATEDLTIRGSERNNVVLNGEDVKSNGIVVTADGVQVENLRVENYILNGVLVTGMSDESGGLARGSDGYRRLDPDEFPPLSGFAVQYVTAANNGLYGIYAFDSHDGLIAHNYSSGSSDSGIYVGQCQECNILVRDNVAELNAVGYEQANASDSVSIIGNRFSDNRLGMTLISDYQEAFVPLKGGYVAGNLVANNDNPDTPSHAEGGFGVGLGISGAQDLDVAKNLFADNPRAGVEVTSSEDLAPKKNKVRDNAFEANGLSLAYTASERAPGIGNCASGDLGATAPKNLSKQWTCPDGHPKKKGTEVTQDEAPTGVSYREVGKPGEQPSMPESARIKLGEHTGFDRDEVSVPEPTLFDDLVQANNPGK